LNPAWYRGKSVTLRRKKFIETNNNIHDRSTLTAVLLASRPHLGVSGVIVLEA
jgi:hypothetical protein